MNLLRSEYWLEFFFSNSFCSFYSVFACAANKRTHQHLSALFIFGKMGHCRAEYMETLPPIQAAILFVCIQSQSLVAFSLSLLLFFSFPLVYGRNRIRAFIILF